MAAPSFFMHKKRPRLTTKPNKQLKNYELKEIYLYT